MVETAEQYLDIFQGLKDELTIRDLSLDYIDLSPGSGRLSYDSGKDDEFIYPEEEDNYYSGEEGNYNQGGFILLLDWYFCMIWFESD